VVVPTHHDAFFAPLEEGLRLLPTVDLAGFFAEAARLRPRARILSPHYRDAIFLPAAGAARDAVLCER
jgi:hypothetical protein